MKLNKCSRNAIHCYFFLYEAYYLVLLWKKLKTLQSFPDLLTPTTISLPDELLKRHYHTCRRIGSGWERHGAVDIFLHQESPLRHQHPYHQFSLLRPPHDAHPVSNTGGELFQSLLDSGISCLWGEEINHIVSSFVAEKIGLEYAL